MYGKKFFQKQTEVTRLKTLIYEQYLGSYLIQNIAKFKKCYILDLFCGPGKNGCNNGSPLILIDILKNLLKVKYVQNIAEVEVIFNDVDKDSIRKLRHKLSKMDIPSNIKINLLSEAFEEVLPNISLEEDSYKFFFLDPFNYSNISLNDLKNIFSLQNTEIFLFVPVFHAYRFSRINSTRGKIRDFILSYTTRGISNYKNVYDFVGSIQKKLVKYLGTPWVREFILHDESRINALFLITKNMQSMMAANEIFWTHTKNGKDISHKHPADTNGIINSFYKSLKRKIREKRRFTSIDIVKFTAVKKFCIRHANKLLEHLKLKEKTKAKQVLNC